MDLLSIILKDKEDNFFDKIKYYDIIYAYITVQYRECKDYC